MSRTPPSQADLKIDGSQMIVLDYDQETNFVTTFSCQQLVENNVVTPVEVDFFYDLAFSSDVEPEMARKEFEAQLLDRIASEWGLASGNACISPPLTGHFYLVQVSSLPEDQPNQAFGTCIRSFVRSWLPSHGSEETLQQSLILTLLSPPTTPFLRWLFRVEFSSRTAVCIVCWNRDWICVRS